MTVTNYFVSRQHAIAYYRSTEGAYVERAVDRKLADGSIHIGKPDLAAGQKLTTIDKGTRYAIQEGK